MEFLRTKRCRARFSAVLTAAVALTTVSIPAFALTATTTTLAVSASSQSSGTVLTLTATVVAGATQVHPGTVTFCDTSYTRCTDSAVVGRAQLVTGGTAVYKFIPGIRSHTYKAVFAGTTTYSTSSSTGQTVTVTGAHTTTSSISSSGSAGAYTLTGTVVAASSVNSPPTGTYSFYDTSNSNYLLGTGTLGAASVTPSFTLVAGASVSSNSRQGAVGDFNGDGIPDLAIPTQTGNISILLGNGDGTVTATSGSPISLPGNEVDAITGDFNSDGMTDIVVCNWGNNSISVLLGNGDGTFQTPVTIAGAGLGQASAVAAGDFNRDGNLDLAVTSQNGNTVTILLGNGSGGFTNSSSIATGSQPYSVAVADFNGDGYLDLVVGNANASTVTILLGNGSGGFTAASGSPVTVGAAVISVATGDLNGDGIVDVVTGNNTDSTVSILIGNGDGTFKAFTSYTVSSGYKRAVIGDFNGDGKQDIAVSYAGTTNVGIGLGNGNGTFQAQTLYPVSASGCESILAADFNGDGLLDVGLAIQGNHASAVLLNQSSQSATASIASVSIPGNGSHTIDAVYGGDANNATSTSSAITLTASKVTTALSLQAAPASSQYAQQVVLSATLSPYAAGSLTTTGESVTFQNAGVSIGTASLAAGSATLNITSLPVGSNTLNAVYTTDANFLASTSGNVNYTVAKNTPTITWSTPAAIGYGTPLSGTQLNASSGGVAGTFVYTPASGTILGLGANQALSVAFTPTDTANYNTASGATTITVTKTTPTVLLSTSAATVTSGTSLTLSATATAGTTPLTSGTITFCNASATRCLDSAVIGRAQLTSAGSASFKLTPGIGSHSYKAVYSARTNYTTASSAATTVTVTGSYKTASTISVTGSAGNYGLTEAVDAIGSLTSAPTGSVAFYDTSNANYVLGSGTLGSSALTVGFNNVGHTSFTPATRVGAAADFNGDGIVDMVIPKHTGLLMVLLGNGDGTFTTGTSITLATQDASVLAADVNGDGKVDLIASSQGSNQIMVYLGNGDGTFQTAIVLSGTAGPSSLVAADFNGDGNLDIAFTEINNSLVEIMYGDGTGAFPTTQTVSVGSGPTSLVTGDYNGDGVPDLAVANAIGNTVSILINDGTGNFAQATGSPVAVGQHPTRVYAADLNNDGNMDLVTANDNDSTLSILLGNGDGTFAVSSYTAGAGAKYLSIGDYNGDGKQDIAACYAGVLQLGLILGNGDGTFQTQTTVLTANSGSTCVGLVQGDFNGDGMPDLEAAISSSGREQILLNTTGQTASASISSVSIPGNGSHTIDAIYAGDSNNLTSTSSTIALTASKVTTALTLQGAPASSQYGQSMVLTATLTPYQVGGLSTAGETITFLNGGVSIGTGTLSSGVATLTLSTLPAGTDSLTAVYATNANFLASTSSTLSYTVTQTTPTIGLASSGSPAGYATSVTFTATLPAGVAGTVTFKDGSTAIGTATIQGSTAALSTSVLAVGSHSITATWPGDGNYAAGTSAMVTQSIVRVAATATQSSTLNPSLYGDQITVSYTFSGGGAVPTGTATLMDGAVTLATLTLDGSGRVAYTSAAFGAGMHTLVATYNGDSNYF